MKNLLRLARRKLNEARGRDIRIPVAARVPHLFVGSEYGGWDVAEGRSLPAAPTIFSVGLGRDITFDLAAIKRLDARVFGFDPTPKSRQFMETQSLPPSFQYVPLGIAAYDGKATFCLPRSDFDSYSTEGGTGTAADVVECEVRRLGTLARDLNVSSIDILKMDIEGGEYDVIPDVLASGIPIGQLLVELHYEPAQPSFEKAKRLIEQVNAAGFRLFARSPVGRELSFVHERLL